MVVPLPSELPEPRSDTAHHIDAARRSRVVRAELHQVLLRNRRVLARDDAMRGRLRRQWDETARLLDGP